MLPDHLIGMYRQYKQDTDSVASWLASTAKSCGYPADLLTEPTPKSVPTPTQAPKPGGRLKGKARAKAKANTLPKTVPKSEPADKETAKYIIAIKDFLPLAYFIASRHDPPVLVPEVFSSTIDRLIAYRSAFGGKLADSGFETDPESHEKHGYFVGILEAVRQALRPEMTNAAKSSRDDATQSLGGRFAALSVDEPSEAFLKSFCNAPNERPKQQDEVSYEAEPQTSMEDVLFAFTYLADDLRQIRSRIKWIWSKQRDGRLDLAAAAVATDTAISLARGLIDEVAPLLDTQGAGAWEVVGNYYLMTCVYNGFKPKDLRLYHLKDIFNYDTYDVANECYFSAFRILNSFVGVLTPRWLPVIREDFNCPYDPESDRASKTGREKFLEDQVLLSECFTELMTVIRILPSYPVEDEFLREMRTFEQTSKVSFSLVFAAQVYLDIHHTMRAVTRQMFLSMITETATMNKLLESHLELHQNMKIYTWPSAKDQQLQLLRDRIQWMNKDPVHRVKARAYRCIGEPMPSEIEPHRILIRSPVLTGLYVFRVRCEMYDIGIDVANAWGSITYTAHLYNALLQKQLLLGQWADMDAVLSILGESKIWVGGERPAAGDCFQKFSLQMGISAAAFSPKRRHKIHLQSLAGPRGISSGAPVSSMFKVPVSTKAGMNWTPELLDDIIPRGAFLVEGSAENGDLIMTQIEDSKALKDKERLRQKKAKARAAGKSKDVEGLVPEKLVRSLVLALTSESLELSFPWLFMHSWCWKLLKTVKDQCDPVLRQQHPDGYMEKESDLPWVVGYILIAATGGEGPLDLRLLNDAARAVNDLTNGDAGSGAIKIAEMIGKVV